MKSAHLFLVSIVFLAADVRPFAQITIGATPGAGNMWTEFYNSNFRDYTQTFAQVITTPGGVDRALLDFSFQFMKMDAGDVTFTAAVAEWSGNQLANTIWTQSGLSTSTISGGSGSFATFSFSPNVTLDGTKTYALLFLADSTSDTAYARVAYSQHDPDNTQSGALYHFGQTPRVSDFSGLAGPGWSSWAGIYDLAFSATFSSVSAVPEPSIPGLALGLSGLAGYAAWRRRRTATLSCAHQGSAPSITGSSAHLP